MKREGGVVSNNIEVKLVFFFSSSSRLFAFIVHICRQLYFPLPSLSFSLSPPLFAFYFLPWSPFSFLAHACPTVSPDHQKERRKCRLLRCAGRWYHYRIVSHPAGPSPSLSLSPDQPFLFLRTRVSTPKQVRTSYRTEYREQCWLW